MQLMVTLRHILKVAIINLDAVFLPSPPEKHSLTLKECVFKSALLAEFRRAS